MRPGDLYESTHFVLDARGRIVSTREPTPSPGPLFSLTRSADRVAWSVHASVPDELARELERLARSEAPQPDAHAAPRWAERYLESLRGVLTSRSGELAVDHGPAFEFSARIEAPAGVTRLDDERALARHFRGWSRGEIARGRSPAFAVLDDDGDAVSVCFCARSSGEAAEAGVETAATQRGRGLAQRAVAAWALAVRASGRAPLYSTSFSNAASLAVARKLGLVGYASHWRVGAAAG